MIQFDYLNRQNEIVFIGVDLGVTRFLYRITDAGVLISKTLLSFFDSNIVFPGQSGGCCDSLNDSIYFTDNTTDLIYEVNSNNEVIRLINYTDIDPTLGSITGISTAKDKTVWIGDNSNDKIINVNLDTKIILSEIIYTDIDPDITVLGDISVDNNDNLWIIAAAAKNTTYQIDTTGVILSSFSNTELSITLPFGMAFLDFNRLSISDVGNGILYTIDFQVNVISSINFTTIHPDLSSVLFIGEIFSRLPIYNGFANREVVSYEFEWSDYSVYLLQGIKNLTFLNTLVNRVFATTSTTNVNQLVFEVVNGIITATESAFNSRDISAIWFDVIGSGVFQHVTIVNGKAVLLIQDTSTDFIFIDSILDNFNLISNTSIPSGATVTVTFSLVNIKTGISFVDLTAVSNILNKSPLFRNVETDLRLQHKGVFAPSGIPFAFNSLAIGVSTTQNDLGAYDFSYTRNPETVTIFPIDESNCRYLGYELVTITPQTVNLEGYNKVNGRYRNTFDAICRNISFNLSSNYFVGSDFTMDFFRMFESKGNKRYYPEGEPGIFIGIGDNPTTDFYDFNLTFLPRDLRPQWFESWIARVDQPGIWTTNGSNNTIYQIDSFGTELRSISALTIDPAITVIRALFEDGDKTIWLSVSKGAVNEIININSDGSINAGLGFDVSAIIPSNPPLFGMTQDTQSMFWFCDPTNSNLYQIHPIGELLKTIDTTEIDPLFINPVDLTITVNQTIFVISFVQDKIFQIDYDGKIISSFLNTAFDPTATTLSGIAFRGDNTLFINDLVNQTLYHVDLTGITVNPPVSWPGINPLIVSPTDLSLSAVLTTFIEINSHDKNSWIGSFMRGEKLTAQVPSGTQVFIAYIPMLLPMESAEMVSEYAIDGSHMPFYHDREESQPDELHLRNWDFKQTEEEPFD